MFAALGATGAVLIDDVCSALARAISLCRLSVPPFPSTELDAPARLVVVGVIALSFFLVGAVMGRRLKDGQCIAWAAPTALLFAASVGGGIATLAVPHALEMALVVVVLVAPWFGLAMYAGARAWHARAATPAHRLFRRLMWLSVVGNVASLFSRMARRAWESPGVFAHDVPVVLGVFVAAVLGAAMLLTTVFDLGGLRELEVAIATRTVGAGGVAEHHDLGLGDEELRLTAPGKSAYRDKERLLARVHGDVGRLATALWLGGAGFTGVLLGLLLSICMPIGVRLCG